MRGLRDKAVKARTSTLLAQQRSDWGRLVFEASAGRTEQQVADLLGRTTRWVRRHLEEYAADEKRQRQERLARGAPSVGDLIDMGILRLPAS